MDNQIFHIAPLVTVCIPTYNRSGKLVRAVNTLKSCSYQNLEIIISDNASSDDTESVCTKLAASDGRIKYFRHPENRGPTENFEFARNQATGKYFLWLSDDDYHDSDYIKTCVDELERDPALVIVSGLGAYHRGDNILTHYEGVIRLDSDTPLLRAVKFLWYVVESSIVFGVCRRDAIKDCIMPNCLAGDWAWVADVLLNGKIKMIPTVYIYKEYGENMSSSYKQLVSTLCVPHWQKNFPWLVMGVNIANHLAFKSQAYHNRIIFKKLLVYLLIFGVILLKRLNQQIHSFGSKVPFAKQIYRRLIKRSIIA